jgi:hypothetical protein
MVTARILSIVRKPSPQCIQKDEFFSIYFVLLIFITFSLFFNFDFSPPLKSRMGWMPDLPPPLPQQPFMDTVPHDISVAAPTRSA